MSQSSTGKKLHLALGMVGALVVLGGLAFWDDWKTTKDEKAKSEQNRLTTITDDQVGEVHYESIGGTDSFDAAPSTPTKPIVVHAVKKDGAWRLTSPLEAKADEQSIKGLISTIRDYKYDKTVTEDKAKWKDFGLDPPNRRVNLIYTKDGKQTNFEVLIGAKAPVGYSAYVAINGENKVYLGSQHIITSANKTLADFRDKTIATVDETAIKTIRYETPGQAAIEVTKENNKWEVRSPIVTAADDGAIKGLIDDLNKLKATNFIDAPDAASQTSFSKLKEVARVTWTTGTGATTTLQVRGNEKELQVAFDPKATIMKVAEDARAKFTKKLNDFRDRRVVALQTKNAATVEVDGQAFKKVKEDWYTAADAAANPPTGKPKSYIQSLLVDLEFAKAEEIVEASDKRAKHTTAAPAHRIKVEFTPDSKEEPLTIESWDLADAPGKILVRHSRSKSLFVCAKTIVSNTSETSIRPSDEVPNQLNLGKMDETGGGQGKDGDVTN